MSTIVVGLDGSPGQSAVLAAALDLAQRKDARLLLVRAISVPVDVPAAVFAVRPDEVARILVENAQKDLDRLARTIPEERLEGARVVVGTPSHALVDLARESKAGLLVIGSHGYGGLDRLLGTTAAKVVNHATCSVLVVR